MNFEAYADGLRSLLRGRGRGLIVQREIDSTHLLARRIFREFSKEETSPPALDMLAWKQSAGIGRGDHLWASPEGVGIYATQICPNLEQKDRQLLPLRVAVALCAVVNRHLPNCCQLKWPNDLMVGGRKLGGILIDVLGPGEAATGLVSFGINVFGDPKDLTEARATTMEHEGSKVTSLHELGEELLRAVDAAVVLPVDSVEIIDEYRSHSLHRPGDWLSCRVDGEELRGLFHGFDEHGLLILKVNGKERRVAAGEVLLDG
jgi:BirA family biotin operon repressor/biotin-[acetyl-CoA-carboxylase] ligase